MCVRDRGGEVGDDRASHTSHHNGIEATAHSPNQPTITGVERRLLLVAAAAAWRGRAADRGPTKAVAAASIRASARRRKEEKGRMAGSLACLSRLGKRWVSDACNRGWTPSSVIRIAIC